MFQGKIYFRKLSTPSEFLQNLKAQGESGSHYHSNFHDASPVEHTRFKTSRRLITRINNFHRKGKFKLFAFTNHGNDLFVFKPVNSRQNEQNSHIHVLNERCVTSADGEDVDSFHSRMRLIYYIDYDDDEQNVMSPYFLMRLLQTCCQI